MRKANLIKNRKEKYLTELEISSTSTLEEWGVLSRYLDGNADTFDAIRVEKEEYMILGDDPEYLKVRLTLEWGEWPDPNFETIYYIVPRVDPEDDEDISKSYPLELLYVHL